MNTNLLRPILLAASLGLAPLAFAESTAFTWQGRVTDAGQPANGLYDLTFQLFDDSTGGAALETNTFPGTVLSNGTYTATLDFGADAFNGDARWLELALRTNGAADFTTLAPRQAVTPTPYAIRAANAGSVSGTIPDAQLSANVARLNATNTFTGPVTAPQFLGGGSGLSGVAPASGSSNYVAKAGDTMSGSLNLPANGLTVGGSQLVIANGNVGIGTTNPLGDGNDLHIGGSSDVALSFGSSSTASNNLHLVLNSHGTEPRGLRFYAGDYGAGNHLLTLANSGNVGIGTTTPEAGLDLWTSRGARFRFREGFGNPTIRFGQAYDDPSIRFYRSTGGSDGSYYPWRLATAVLGLKFQTGQPAQEGAETYTIDAMTILNNGNVGIGTTTPSAALDVAGDISYSGSLRKLDTAENPAAIVRATDFYLGSASRRGEPGRALVDAGPSLVLNYADDWATTLIGGSVGIGTFTPSQKLDVQGSIAIGNSVLGGGRDYGNPASYNNATLQMYSASSGNTVLNNVQFDLDLKTAGTSRLYVQNAGNVGIGTTNPQMALDLGPSTGRKLGLYDLGSIHAGLGVDLGGGPYESDWYGAAGNIGQGFLSLGFVSHEQPGTYSEKVRIQNNGNVGIGTTTPQTPLHINGSSASASILVQGNASAIMHSASDGTLRFLTGLREDVSRNLNFTFYSYGGDWTFASGNVGIGTASPTAKLEVAGSLKVSGAGNSITTPILSITGGSDVAEPFAMSGGEISPGAVVVIDAAHPGQLKLSGEAYDKRVAGIVSGAGGVNPGLTLSQRELVEGGQNVALTGRVYALADAANGPIEPGDLLTTSAVPGHAMKVTDHALAQGAILGKAMSRLESGRGLVLVLVTLQ